MASVVINAIAPNIDAQIIHENEEPADFWTALNGKGEYDTELDPPGAPFLEPRLFHCKLLSNGKLRVEGVDDYDQEDLDEDDVMILDGGDEVYVWEGKDSSHEERRKSIEVANVRKQNELISIIKTSTINHQSSSLSLPSNLINSFVMSLHNAIEIPSFCHLSITPSY